MPKILKTIDEYVTNIRKKDTIWIVFNTVYNDVHAFNKSDEYEDLSQKYLKKEYTDYEAQKEFLEFMESQFPNVHLEQVFDYVSAGYLQYPYLGSYAIDTDVGSEVYKALVKKYGDPYKDDFQNNAILWIIDYDNAKTIYEERKRMWENQ